MKVLHSPNLLDKARRHDKRERVRNPSWAPLIPGAGKIESNGSLKAELPAADGTVRVYCVTSRTEYLFDLVRSLPSHKAISPAVASPADTAKQALEVALNIIADLERRAHAAGQSPISTASTAAG
jgi:hypothetical protein